MWTERRSGQRQKRSLSDHRDPFERDHTRVVHCHAFRRLQRKTQILRPTEGDFHRTRLTHSLEVASIARSIVRKLKKEPLTPETLSTLPNDDLITAISLLHDIGHPPFGHGGEVALNYIMHAHGGFESNAQTLRLLMKLENMYGPFGLDLTRRTLLGILKYPAPYSKLKALSDPPLPQMPAPIHINDWLPPKCYFDSEQPELNWLLAPLPEKEVRRFQTIDPLPSDTSHGRARYKSLDCSIMDLADDIAYGVHDLEDAIYLKLLSPDLVDGDTFKTLFNDYFIPKERSFASSDLFIKALFSEDPALGKHAIGELVNGFIISSKIQACYPFFESPLLRDQVRLPEEVSPLLQHFKNIVYRYVIDSQQARILEYSGQTIIQRLFEAIASNPEQLLPELDRVRYHNAQSEWEARRVLCDHIATFTDLAATRLYERLFGFNTRTLFTF